jgi:hypothetical protein
MKALKKIGVVSKGLKKSLKREYRGTKKEISSEREPDLNQELSSMLMGERESSHLSRSL